MSPAAAAKANPAPTKPAASLCPRGSCRVTEIQQSAAPHRNKPADPAQVQSSHKRNTQTPRPFPGSPACSCSLRRGPTRELRSHKSRVPPTPPPAPSSPAETTAIHPPGFRRATATRASPRGSAAPISLPSGIASSIAAAPAASVTHAFRSAPAGPSSPCPAPSPALGSTASYPAPRIASTSCSGAASAGSNTTLARCAIKSTRACSTPAVPRSASST